MPVKNRKANCKDRDSRGMSMLELVIVVAIISAISVVAVPQLLDVREDYRLIAVAGEVVGVMNNTRILSVSRNTDMRVNVSASGTYLVQADDGSWTTESTYTLPDGFTFSTTGAIMQFHPRGNATPVASVQIINPNGNTRNVVVELSGRSYSQ